MHKSNSIRVLWAYLMLSAIMLGMLIAAGCTPTEITEPNPPNRQFHVYFNNDGMTEGKTICDAVFPVSRSLPYSSNGASAALEALFLGPTAEERSQGYRSFFSEHTAGLLKRLRIETGTAYIDLHDMRDELAGTTSSCGSAEFFSQIQQTLAEFPGINRIIFAIEGNPAVFYGWMEIECDQRNHDCDSTPFKLP